MSRLKIKNNNEWISILAGGVGVPTGGTAGQILAKNSATDYDVHWVNKTQDYPSAYCTTAAATAAKKASCSLWVDTANSYLHVLIGQANTSAGAITLNVNSTGAKPVYINGAASSATNYTLPAGSYIVFYDGTNFYFRTDGKLTANITGTADGIFDLVYPVGSIYMSVNSTSPATLFGGTWERIRDTFLLAAGSTYSAGDTGGEAEHTLTVEEMPSHSHPAPLGINGNNYFKPVAGSAIQLSTNTNTGATGGGQPHNNMPPYLAVYVWKRTA